MHPGWQQSRCAIQQKSSASVRKGSSRRGERALQTLARESQLLSSRHGCDNDLEDLAHSQLDSHHARDNARWRQGVDHVFNNFGDREQRQAGCADVLDRLARFHRAHLPTSLRGCRFRAGIDRRLDFCSAQEPASKIAVVSLLNPALACCRSRTRA